MTTALTKKRDSEEDDMEGMEDVLIRRAVPADEEAIIALVGEESYVNSKRFGDYTIIQLIETNILSMVAVDAVTGELVGFAAFHHSPLDNQERIPSGHWEKFVRDNYDKCPYNTDNTLWMSFFQSDPLMEENVREGIFRTMFTTFPRVHYVLFHVQKRMFPAVFYPVRDHFTMFEEKEENSSAMENGPEDRNDSVLWLLTRQTYIPRLRIRLGRVEDNDDLKPLLQNVSNLTTFDMSGDYYLADLLHKQDGDHKFIVGLHHGQLVGLMYLCTCDFEGSKLRDNFDMQEYEGLVERQVTATADGIRATNRSTDPLERINAFQVTAFFVFPEFMDRSIDFLEAAFHLFPNRPYCVISLPFTSHEVPLLESFKSIKPKPTCSVREGLHVASRNAFFDPLLARIATHHDSPELTEFVARSDEEWSVNGILQEEGEDNDSHTVVIQNSVNGDVVGCAVVKNAQDVVSLRRQFRLDELVRTSQHPAENCCVVKRFHSAPQYHTEVRNMLKQIMRLLKKTLLLYCTTEGVPTNQILDRYLIRADPKRPIQMPDGIPSFTDVDEMPSVQELYATGLRYLSEPKTEINSRIVVVGGSKTGLGFVHALTKVPFLYFNNILMITLENKDDEDEGMDQSKMTNALKTSFAGDEDYLEHREIETVERNPNISIVGGRIRDFDRRSKTVMTCEGEEFHFDMLCLTTSRLYRLPRSIGKNDTDGSTSGVVDLEKSQRCFDEISNHAHGKLRRLDDFSHVIVYGSSLDAICTINTLITEYCVDPQRIMLISPNGKHPALDDDELERKVNSLFDALQIKHFDGYSVDSYDNDDDGKLRKVWLSNSPAIEEQKQRMLENGEGQQKDTINKKVVDVTCHLLINAQYQDVDPGLLGAIHHQSLVFDGRLIVDPRFRTTDPAIYAAGPLAKFSRRYGVSDPMEKFNTWEVGGKMASNVMKDLGIVIEDVDVEADEDDEDSAEEKKIRLPRTKFPVFETTITRRGLLPGKNRFFQVQVPNHVSEECRALRTSFPPIPASSSTEAFKRNLINHRQRYMSIMVNRMTGIIESLTYYGKEEIEEHNMKCVVGLPASYLNDMVGRFDEGLIEDFVVYLRQHWTMALFCDRFKHFRHELLREIENVSEAKKYATQLFYDIVQRTKLNDTGEGKEPNGEPAPELSKQGVLLAYKQLSSTTSHYIERELLKFLHEYEDELGEVPPVYHVPSIV